MRLIGKWRDFVENYRKLNEKRIVDIYVFNNPELINSNEYNSDVIRVHPKNNDYRHWLIESGVLREIEDQGLIGIGICKDCLFDLGETNLTELSEGLGIGEPLLESILSGC